MHKIARSLTLASAGLLLLLAGCGEVGGPNGRTSLRIDLTDAPGDVLAAVVTISEITLPGGSGPTDNLLTDPVTTDLVPLATDPLTLVSGLVVPEGEYSSLRFVITGGYIEVEGPTGESEFYASSPDYEGLPDGANVVGTLQMPSFGSSGLKVQFGGQETIIISGAQTTLTVDFDVSESFGMAAGQSGMWVMHPVLKGTQAPAPTT